MGPIMDHLVSRGQGLLHLWDKSGIQILVLLSFGMQVFLLAFGYFRRRSSSPFLRAIGWLVYLLADFTAIYALGHLSVASGGGSRKRPLVSFWAPFLLLHLGGPDNITAYSLEDNRLWKRHLQNLIVQVLAAAYVTYESMASGGAFLLLLASISMFVVGLAKYGERTWALKRSDTSSIPSSLPSYPMNENPNMSDEEILLVAHRSLHASKDVLITDIPPSFSDFRHYRTESRFKIVEMHLSLLYDALYTKAVVIHTWYGFYIHIVSVLGTATAFLLFHLHLTRISSNNGYKRGDVIVSYILLMGALVLEAISLCKALVSSWTRSLLHGHIQKEPRPYHRNTDRKLSCLQWLLDALTYLGRHVQSAHSRRWEGSIGQYNLFHLCTRTHGSNKLGCWLDKKMRWNKVHFTGTFTPDDKLKESLLRAMIDVGQLGLATNPRGTSFLMLKRLSLVSLGLRDEMFGRDLNESILIWSILTEKYIHSAKHKQEEDERVAEDKCKLIKAIEVLSNYLMFLLVVKPEMLPDPRPQEAHADICLVLDKIWRSRYHGDDEHNPCAASHKSWKYPFYVLKEQFQRLTELFHRDGPNASSRIKQRKELLLYMWNTAGFVEKNDGLLVNNKPNKYCFSRISWLSKLVWKALADKIELSDMLMVWTDMLMYAAEHCSRDSHVRNLSDNNGGEFITIMWLAYKYHIPTEVFEETHEVEETYDELELEEYDGSDPTKPLLMAIKGKIYDVSESRTLFGPGGHYSLFAAKDASRAIAKMSFKPEDLTSDISGLEPSELDTLKEWEDFFMKNHTMIGDLVMSRSHIKIRSSFQLGEIDEEELEQYDGSDSSFQLGEIDEEELEQYDGSDPDKPLLMAIKGKIYDVSSKRGYFGPGGQYSFCAGKDASRAIAKGILNGEDPLDISCLKPEDLSSDISGLGPYELQELLEQEIRFTEKFTKVGTIKESIPLQVNYRRQVLPPRWSDQVVKKMSSSLQLGEIDEEELKQYDGSYPDKPILMAIKGQIYDVTSSRKFYGPGGHYSLFASKDASRAIAKMSFEPEDLTSDVSGLKPFELGTLQEWEDFFVKSYTKVGTIKREETKEEFMLEAEPLQVVIERSPSFQLGEINEEELIQYDGSDADKPLLMAIKGIIYDVTKHRFLYGPGGKNRFYAGKDASRAIAKNSFEPEDLTSDISGLILSEHDTLKQWEDKFKREYAKVGTINKSVLLQKSPCFHLGEIDEKELNQYDGSDPTKPLLLAVKGNIYDVTEHSLLFGPGGTYSILAGKDASRAIAKMSSDPEDLTSDISGLEPSELDNLQAWEDMFKENNAKVGSIKKIIP